MQQGFANSLVPLLSVENSFSTIKNITLAMRHSTDKFSAISNKIFGLSVCYFLGIFITINIIESSFSILDILGVIASISHPIFELKNPIPILQPSHKISNISTKFVNKLALPCEKFIFIEGSPIDIFMFDLIFLLVPNQCSVFHFSVL